MSELEKGFLNPEIPQDDEGNAESNEEAIPAEGDGKNIIKVDGYNGEYKIVIPDEIKKGDTRA